MDSHADELRAGMRKTLDRLKAAAEPADRLGSEAGSGGV